MHSVYIPVRAHPFNLAIDRSRHLFVDNCGTELAQHETALVFVLSLINDSKDEGQSALAEQALALIDSMARCSKYRQIKAVLKWV